jgi:hypothetical protein
MAQAQHYQLPAAFAEERTMQKMRDDPMLYEGLREIIHRRREQRREQLEAAEGEKAAVLRGRSQELTAILNELFPQLRKET